MTSSTSSPCRLPQWLQDAETPGHFATVLQVLLKREKERLALSNASRHKTSPSLTHRIAHLPSTLLKNDEVVKHYSISIACDPEHRNFNRYSDVTPYDRTRVVVGHNGSEEPSGRYLNASWVRELAGGKWWIASQAPLPDTIHAFLSVILEPVSPPPAVAPQVKPLTGSISRVRTVVQLTRDIESGMRKAHAYIPPNVGDSWISAPEPNCNAKPLKITLLDVAQIDEAHCLQSTVSVQPLTPKNEPVGEPVVFKHMLFSSWPDHSVPEPEDRAALLRFVHLVDRTNRDLSSQPESVRDRLDPDPPIIVGCSAGIGRTGSFIALSSLLRAYRFLPAPCSLLHEPNKELPPLEPSPLGPLPEDVRGDRVAEEIDALREQRPGMVQRPDQVQLIYECLVMAFATAKSTTP
ncbi:tyrosine-protein phosphatase [Phanerochaete sordida]|uniref:Tyrosine-protein phosphatase n=1 Tax=Phanerochaete sordida TaxID=48140 RepID=A0A9P3LCQ5_9APHY|nr:tyrosine-protein phosphatase [Phanerochaete sordida]